MKRLTLFLALAGFLASIVVPPSASAVILYKNQTKTCWTRYKDNGSSCPSIQSAGSASGCIDETAVNFPVTNATGKASVSVVWDEEGTGTILWNTVGTCTPSRPECSIACRAKLSSQASAAEASHSGAIDNHVGDLIALFDASGVSAVNAAISQVASGLAAVPNGPNYTASIESSAISEVNALSGASDIEVGDVPTVLSVESLMDSDVLALYPETPVPTLSEWSMIVLVLLMIASGVWFMRRQPQTV